ncbi:MAG TPA: TadE/TadG family type IV pilus assembly protein [Pirellulales bacterium]|nr:TadE/TadG family type IV pilus assembly protein [Pirellulales bacterium]
MDKTAEFAASRHRRPRFRWNRRAGDRRGTAVVEAAVILPILLTMMFGVWEVGRMIEVSQILDNAAREGARLAAGGYVNGTAVTTAQVQTAVQNYMTAAGLPSAAISGAQITLTCLASTPWTDPYEAQPLDPFTVTVTIPSGAAFNSLRWNLLNQVTSVTQLSQTVYWQSANNSQVVVSTTLPY